ncbi:hypothetical protein [Algivirga pacifica]|uniref:Uncharacterized protein n=1 Tax=Algivirga pacifica TaxID=1162670 RepID=A0ABP9CZU6_9BACT
MDINTLIRNNRKTLIAIFAFAMAVTVMDIYGSYVRSKRQPPFLEEDYDSLINDQKTQEVLGKVYKDKLEYIDFSRVSSSNVDTTSYKITLHGEKNTLEYSVYLQKSKAGKWSKYSITEVVK